MRIETIWTGIGGVIVGYLLWLVAISIGDAVSTVSMWCLVVLLVSAVFALWAVLRGRRFRRQRNYPLASFMFALPILPVLLSLGVVFRTYI
jgi:heme O synthase-like polyprenyltransferase